MLDVLTETQRGKLKRELRAKNPANKKLNQRTQPNARNYVSRLGYNIATTTYTQGIEIGRLSGSSLNRYLAKKKSDEFKALYKKQETFAQGDSTPINEQILYEESIDRIRDAATAKQRDRRKFSRPLDKFGNPVHMLSPRSKGKVRDKCTAFYRSCGQQRTFATLTFIAPVGDKTAVSILNKFFTQLREDCKKLKYIWVAERQPKTDNNEGRIHFHVIFNQRLPVRRYNALWVLQQYNAGLRFESITDSEIRQRYEEGTIHEVLNPFDIEKIKSIYGLSFYLTKYITKNKSGAFQSLAWHCSRNVSRLFTKTVVSRSCMRAVESFVNSKLDRETGEIKKAPPIQGAFWQAFLIENKTYFLPDMSEMETVNRWVLDGMLPDRIPEINDFDIGKFFNN